MLKPNLTPMTRTNTPINLSTQAHPSLDMMAGNATATIIQLKDPCAQKSNTRVVQRLSELGFLPGELVTVLRRGPGGREPIAVQIGETIFALRRLEASCIKVADSRLAAQI